MRSIAAPGALSFLLAVAWMVLAVPSAPAQDAKTDPAAVSETEEEKKEREGRRQCAVLLCSTLHNRKPSDGQVSCNVRKTWRKEILNKILSRGKISWPWGDTRCGSEIRVDRALLVQAMQGPEFDAQFDAYDVRCEIDNDKGKYDVAVQIKPKVVFKDGKAVKANLNWGKIEAPTLAKGALWSITASDNTFGLLQGIAVEEINEFITTKCAEVKGAWQGK